MNIVCLCYSLGDKNCSARTRLSFSCNARHAMLNTVSVLLKDMTKLAPQ